MKRFIFCLLGVAIVAGGLGLWWLWTPPTFPTTEGEVIAEEDRQYLDPLKVDSSPKQVDGFPESVVLHEGGRTVEARYTGKLTRMRKMVIVPFRLYEMACYVPTPHKGDTYELLDELLVDGEPKIYILKFLTPLPGRSILKDIYHEINTTFTDVDMERLRPNIDRFVHQFARGSHKGDLVYIVWLPGGRIYSGFAAPTNIEFIARDVPFARALWRIWAGPQSGPERIGLVQRFSVSR